MTGEPWPSASSVIDSRPPLSYLPSGSGRRTVESVNAGGEGLPAVSLTASVQGPSPALFVARTRTWYVVPLVRPVIVVVAAALIVLACQSVHVPQPCPTLMRCWMS